MFLISKSIINLTVVVTLLAHFSLQQEQSEEDVDGAVDSCNSYDTENGNDCHHNHFRQKPTIESIYGQKVTKCCKGHSYKFYDHCEVSSIGLGFLNTTLWLKHWDVMSFCMQLENIEGR